MAKAEVIREYLVSLGFKTDEASLKKFNDGITNAAKGVVKLVGAIEGAALAVGAGVAAFASNLEQLYRVSQRTNAATGEIKALDLAAQSLGANAGDSTAALEGLAKFVRETPGGGAQSLLRSWGIDAQVLDGKLMNVGEAYVALARKFQGMSFAESKLYANQLGINDNMLLAMRDPNFEANYRRELANTGGLQEAAAQAAKMMIELRDIMLQVYVIAARITREVFHSFGVEFQDFGTWLRTNGDVIVQKISALIEQLLKLAALIFPSLKWLYEKFMELDEATDGWSTKIAALLVVLNSLGALSLISGITALTGAFAGLGGAITAAAIAAGTLAVPVATIAALVGHDNLNKGEAEWLAARDKAQAEGKPLPPLPGVEKQAMEFFMGYGWTKAQAAGIVANLKNESQLNPNAENATGHYGIAQWDKSRRADFKEWSLGKDIKDSDLLDQMRFVQYELTKGKEQQAGALLKAATTEAASSDVMFRHYERAGDATGPRRASDAVNISQQTNINVTGSQNPVDTGKAVAGEQNRVNQNLTRNLQPMVR